MFKIENVFVNYQKEPLGICRDNISFGWQYGFGENICQNSFKIVVKEKTEIVWDTGIIYSSKSSSIEYEGKLLKACTLYIVDVEVTDKKGRIATAQTFFETGIDANEFNIPWLCSFSGNGGTALFRQKITLSNKKNITRARAYVCGLGCCDFYVNGKLMNTDILSPCVSEYSKRIYYRTYDIIEELTEGLNVLGYEVGYGWYGKRELGVIIAVEYADGREEKYTSGNGSWGSSYSQRIGNGIYDGEIFDATLTQYNGWMLRTYDDSAANGWVCPAIIFAPRCEIMPMPCNEIIEDIEFDCKSKTKISDNVYVIDAGKNIAGFAKIKVKGVKGTKIILKFAELLKDNGDIDSGNLRSAKCTDIYILSGNGEEEYKPRFTYHGFQFIRLEICGKAELIDLKIIPVHASLKRVGDFNCSLDILNQLHQMAWLTEQNNQHGTLTDCPQRDERFGWLNDWSARLFQTVYNFSCERYFPKMIVDVADGQQENGAICDTAPYYAGGCPADPVCVSFLLLGLFSYRLYGNKSIIKNYYKNFKAWVDYLDTRHKGYIMDYSYYNDWVASHFEGEPYSDPIFISSAFFIWHLEVLSKIAKILGNNADKNKYELKCKKAKKAVDKVYFNGKYYANGTQCENVLAIGLNIADKIKKEMLIEYLLFDIKAHNYHSTCGNQGYRWLFDVLAESGNIDAVLAILSNPEYPGWGYMVKNASTTVWERWESKMKSEMNSFNHPMFASYDELFYKYLGGIKILDNAEGCNLVEISPVFPKTLEFVKCSFQTLNGTIISNWKREGGVIICNVVIPSNTVAVVKIGKEAKKVFSGKYVFKLEDESV